jgi:hypothetical protein
VVLEEREATYRESEDPMVVHQTVVDAVAADLAIPNWAVMELAKWSRKLLAARGRSASLTGQQIGVAMELLDQGPGRGTPLSRAKARDLDAHIYGAIEGVREIEGTTLLDAIEKVAGLLDWPPGKLRNARNRHRARLKARAGRT